MCDCVTKVSEHLKEHNTKLVLGMAISNDRKTMTSATLLQTEKIDKKLRQPAMQVRPMYCPFCGEAK